MTIRSLAVVAVLAAVAQAQQDPQALEAALTARAVQLLHEQADALAAQKQWLAALQLRFELLAEYDDEDARARDLCGFVKVGNAWRRDHEKLVLETNAKGDKRALKKLEQQWQKAEAELATLHEQLAKAWSASGNPSKAARHLARLLRFRPGDQQLAGQLQLSDFGGFRGSERDLGMLRRSRLITAAVQYLRQREVPVELLAGQQLPLLQRAKLKHQGVRSRHFTVWGSLPEPLLRAAAQYAERSLLLTRALFAVQDGAPFAPQLLRDIVLVPDQDSYAAVVGACADQFDAARRKFLEQDVDFFYPEDGGRSLRCYKIERGEPIVLDLAVRGVVQDALGVTTDGVWEGVGHAFCGFFFDQTLTFMVEQKTAHTVTGWHDKPLLPDMKVWREIAAETAWSKADTPSAQLALLQAARFTNQERVKAWSMVDYLIRRQPDLVLALDRSRTDRARTQPEVEAEFQRLTQLSLPDLDAEWCDFWAKDKPLRDAIDAEPLGKKDDLAAAQALGTAIDDARTAADVGPVGWYVAGGDAVVQAMQYLADCQRAEADGKRNPKQPVELPPWPQALAGKALAHAGKDAAAAVAAWFAIPSSRDLLLHPGRVLIGCSRGKSGFALDLGDPVRPIEKGAPLQYPAAGQQLLPRSARAGDLGLGVAAALHRQPGDLVGYPLTLHFFRALSPIEQAAVQCRVLDGVHRLDGTVLPLADGCFAFVAAEPLPSATDLEVTWTLPPRVLAKDEQFPAATFTTASN